MRLTHTSALRGFAVFTAGAALFASAMLGGAGAANASGISPDQAAALTAAQTQTDLAQQNGEHCWGHHKHGKGKWDGKKDGKDSRGDKSDQSDSKADGKKDGKKDGMDSKTDGMDNWSKNKDDGTEDKNGKSDNEHSKSDGKHESDNQQRSSDEHSRGGDPEHSRCQMPTGSVESGLGGTALASSQSPASTISLGGLAALMLGSGIWTLYRSRRTRSMAK